MAPASAPTGRGDGGVQRDGHGPGRQAWRSGSGSGRFTVDSGGGLAGTLATEPLAARSTSQAPTHPIGYHHPAFGMTMTPFVAPHAGLAASFANPSPLDHPVGVAGPSSLPANFGWAGPSFSTYPDLLSHSVASTAGSWTSVPPHSAANPVAWTAQAGVARPEFDSASLPTTSAPGVPSVPSAPESASASPLDLFRPVSGFHGLMTLPGAAPRGTQPKSRSLLTDLRPKEPAPRPAGRDLQSIATALQSQSGDKAEREQWRSPPPTEPPSGAQSPNPGMLTGHESPVPGLVGPSGVFSPTESFFGSFQGALDFDTPAPLENDPFATLGAGAPSGSPSNNAFGTGDSAYPSAQSGINLADQSLPSEMIDLANAALELRDPLAAKVWKMYGEATSKLPTDKEIEEITWRVMGMGLGELRKRMAESEDGRSSAIAPEAPVLPAAENVSQAPSVAQEAAGKPVSADADPKGKGTAAALRADARGDSPERGRRGRSQGTSSKTQTPESDIMDWRAKSRSRSRPPEDSRMDWRALSRSRSRAPFRLSMPMPPFNTDFDFSSAVGEPLPADITASPAAYNSFDLATAFAAADSAESTPGAGPSAGVNDEAIRRLYSQTSDRTGHLDASFAHFDFGSLGLPMGPSQSTLLGSIPGLTEDHARIANAHAEYGSLPRLVRKTSYDQALLQAALTKNMPGKKDGRSTEPASPKAGRPPKSASEKSRKRAMAQSPARPSQGPARIPTQPPSASTLPEVPGFNFSFPESLSASSDSMAFANLDMSRAPQLLASPWIGPDGFPLFGLPTLPTKAGPAGTSALEATQMANLAQFGNALLRQPGSAQPPPPSVDPAHVNVGPIRSLQMEANVSRSGSSAGADTPSPASSQIPPAPPIVLQPAAPRSSASTPNLTGMKSIAPMPSIRPAQPAPSSKKAPAKKERDRTVPVANPDGTPIQCLNCKTSNTPLWRRDVEGKPLCNACGLFLNLHGVPRPVSLNTGVIKRRNRGKNTDKSSKKSSSGRAASRRNSVTTASTTTAVNAAQATGVVLTGPGGSGEAKRIRTAGTS